MWHKSNQSFAVTELFREEADSHEREVASVPPVWDFKLLTNFLADSRQPISEKREHLSTYFLVYRHANTHSPTLNDPSSAVRNWCG